MIVKEAGEETEDRLDVSASNGSCQKETGGEKLGADRIAVLAVNAPRGLVENMEVSNASGEGMVLHDRGRLCDSLANLSLPSFCPASKACIDNMKEPITNC